MWEIERVLGRFNLAACECGVAISSNEIGCVRVQSSRYQSYTWKEGVKGGMGKKEATWEKVGGV